MYNVHLVKKEQVMYDVQFEYSVQVVQGTDSANCTVSNSIQGKGSAKCTVSVKTSV